MTSPSRAAPIVPAWGESDTLFRRDPGRGTFWKARVLNVSRASVEKGAGGGEFSVKERRGLSAGRGVFVCDSFSLSVDRS